MPELTITGRNGDGKAKQFPVSGICLACMGKSEQNMGRLRTMFGDHKPMTVSFDDLCSTSFCSDERHTKALSRLWGMCPALESCMTPPDQILKSGKAMFDVANYSMNTVMMAMFFLRMYLNDHLVRRCDNPVFEPLSESLGLDRAVACERLGMPWWYGFICAIAPNFLGGYTDVENLGEQARHADANVLCYTQISCETLAKLIKGEYEGWELKEMSYEEHLRTCTPYTQNIESQIKGGKGSVKMWSDLHKAIKPGGQVTKKDIFGKVISTTRGTGKDERSQEELAQQFMDCIDNHMGKFMEGVDA